MKRFSASIAALLFGVVTANAADMPVKSAPVAAAPAVAPVYNWSGWYLGAHAGGVWTHLDGIFDNLGAEHLWRRNNGSGAVLGAQIGFNVQNGIWVWGLEGDWSWANARKSIIDDELNTQSVKTRDLASIRARLGIASNNWLFYGTAGWGHGGIRIGTELDEGAPNAAWRSLSASGVVYGGGIEWGVNPNWTLRVEYLRYQFNKTLNYPDNIVNDADDGDFFKYKNADVVRVGLNYRVNWR